LCIVYSLRLPAQGFPTASGGRGHRSRWRAGADSGVPGAGGVEPPRQSRQRCSAGLAASGLGLAAGRTPRASGSPGRGLGRDPSAPGERSPGPWLNVRGHGWSAAGGPGPATQGVPRNYLTCRIFWFTSSALRATPKLLYRYAKPRFSKTV
jgi:hypothetical protein